MFDDDEDSDHDTVARVFEAEEPPRADSLRRAVEARDRQFTDAKHLRLMPRQRVERVVCGTCWRVLSWLQARALTECPCGGKLHVMVT